ncbi:DNase I-like protein [Lyophyllum atratum]|nr:DNase I-like protein [Lyophyllum atratum]
MAEDAIRGLLRSSEHLKAILETQYPQASTGDWESIKHDLYRERDDESTRIIAVVAHRDDWRVSEEGSVFICKFNIAENDSTPELEIQRVFPITEDFSITIAQARQKTVDLGGRVNAEQQTVNPGKSLDPDIAYPPMSFLTSDMRKLRNLLTECKELHKIYEGSEDLNALQSETRFQWLLPYTSKQELPQTFGLIQPDLRLVNRPLHLRLSPAAAGIPGDDVTDIRLIRDEWIQTQARDTSRQGRRKLKIRLGTFNVNGKLPSQDLSDWMGIPAPAAHSYTTISPLPELSPLSLGEVTRDPFKVDKPSTKTNEDAALTSDTGLFPNHDNKNTVNKSEYIDPETDPDVFVLGFQELDLSTEALLYGTGTAREDTWCVAVFAALGEKGTLYTKLASKQLVGMLIVVLVKKTLVSCFTDVRTSAAGAGIMGLMGNKGGIAVRITFTPPSHGVTSTGPTTFTFVNAHLAAFDEMLEKRNADFQDLSKRLNFESEIVDTPGLSPLLISAYETDVLFWMGGKSDLNYRVDLPDADVRGVLASSQWEGRFETLLRYDQLTKVMHDGRAFTGFMEHPMSHPPTYRFSHGILTDELGYDIKRKPAWTDRILYMAAPSISLNQLSYTSHPHITMSDHRPVAADFVIDVDLYNKELRDATARKLYRTAHRMEDPSDRTAIKLDKTSVDMGQILYNRSTSQTIRLQNTGKGPCAYRLVPVNPNSEIHPEWLRVEPMQASPSHDALILPGEIAYITLTASVDNESASKLNLGAKDLVCTLILRTIMGKDHFITVTGEYQYTCFANRLSRLTRLPGPIRALKSPDDLRPKDHPINAPREVMRLVNWMMSDHVNLNGLFILPADENLVDTIRECLDSGDDFPFAPECDDPQVALAFATTLIRFLDSLVDPIVPVSLHPRCAQMTSRDEAFELLDAFPSTSVNVWISVTAFLHFMCQSPTVDQPSDKAEKIATIFAPVLLRDDPYSPLPPASPLGKRNFVLYFIS